MVGIPPGHVIYVTHVIPTCKPNKDQKPLVEKQEPEKTALQATHDSMN
jgi:hypothetical protein